MMSKDGSFSWYKNIPNRITSQKGSIYADSYFPFVHNSQFYLIQNTHEENPARALKGEKAKITMPGKDKMGTELISLGEKGKLKRDFIYLTESNFAPIPEMTQRIGAGKYLLYADHTFFGNSFMLGKLEVLK